MSDIDEILASGRYVDRRGREWEQWEAFDGTVQWVQALHDWPFLEDVEMRLLVERDMHRDVCTGLYECTSHPVAHVLADGRSEFVSYRAANRDGVRVNDHEDHTTLPEAIDAARALAVGE